MLIETIIITYLTLVHIHGHLQSSCCFSNCMLDLEQEPASVLPTEPVTTPITPPRFSLTVPRGI